MIVPRSVKMYRFHSLAGVRNTIDILASTPVGKPSVVVGDRTHPPVIHVDPTPRRDRISGIVRIPDRLETEAGELLGYNLYGFSLSKQRRLAVVQTGKAAPVKVLSALLGNRTTIDDFEYNRDALDRVVRRMLKAGAILHDPRFEFAGADGYDGLARSGFTPTRERCATKRAHYREMLNRSSKFEPVLRVYQAGGICEEARAKGLMLKIKSDLTLSTYSDISMESWVAFIEQYVLPEIVQDTLDNDRSGRS